MYMRSPFDELYIVFRDFDDLFRRTLSSGAPVVSERANLASSGGVPGSSLVTQKSARWPSAGSSYLPAVESFSKDAKLFIRAELPGVEPADLNVSVTGNTLQISGEKRVAREMNEADVYFREIEEGRFERSFTLPDGVKSDQLKARFENGVLELSMPVPEEKKTRKIEIEAPAGKQIKAA
jgi:HSP20 family protein